MNHGYIKQQYFCTEVKRDVLSTHKHLQQSAHNEQMMKMSQDSKNWNHNIQGVFNPAALEKVKGLFLPFWNAHNFIALYMSHVQPNIAKEAFIDDGG